MDKKNAKYEQKKMEIMISTFQLFIEKGYEDTSITDIMKANKLSKGAIYHYFESKEDILNSVLNLIISKEIEMIEPILNDDKMSQLEKILKMISVEYTDKTVKSKEVFEEVVKRPKSIFVYKVKEASKNSNIPILTAIIEKGIAIGEFNTKYAEETAQVLYSLGEVICEHILAGKDKSLLKPKVEGFSSIMALNLGLDKDASEELLKTLYKKFLIE